MPIRALAIFLFGIFWLWAGLESAYAQVPPGIPADAEPVTTVRVDLNNCCWNSSKVIDQPSDGSWYQSELIAGPSIAGCHALGPPDCRVSPGNPLVSQAYTGSTWQNSTVTYKCLNGSAAQSHGTSDPIKYCAAGNGYIPPPDCAGSKGTAIVCEYAVGDPGPGDGGCHLGCTVTKQNAPGVSLAGYGSVLFDRFVYNGDACEPASVPFCASHKPDGPPPGLGPDENMEFGDDGSLSQDGNSGNLGPGDDGSFDKPPPGGCSYSDDGVITCDDGTGYGDGDGIGEVGTDTTGDGVPDDGYNISDHWGPGVPAGSTIVDPDTGQTLGTAIDQDGDGVTDGVDTDGDGDIDFDSPDDPGAGRDNNGDGVVNESDGDNDGDGQSGGAGDCVDDPETEADECGGTDGEPGDASVAGLSCDETPACQPAKDDIQGQLWCAQLQLQHKVSCQYYVQGASESTESLAADKPEDDGSELWETVNLAEDAPGLGTGVVVAGGACFDDISIPLMGRTYVIPMSDLCPVFSAIGVIVLIISYMTAGMIVYRSGVL